MSEEELKKENEKTEKKEVIEAFEEAWFKLIEGVDEATEKLLAQDRNKADTNREFEKTVEKLERDFINILKKAQKTGVSSEEIEKIKRGADKIDDIEQRDEIWTTKKSKEGEKMEVEK